MNFLGERLSLIIQLILFITSFVSNAVSNNLTKSFGEYKMNKFTSMLAGVSILVIASSASAEPVTLTDTQMDGVAAGQLDPPRPPGIPGIPATLNQINSRLQATQALATSRLQATQALATSRLQAVQALVNSFRP
jgi:hypothetical protein